MAIVSLKLHDFSIALEAVHLFVTYLLIAHRLRKAYTKLLTIYTGGMLSWKAVDALNVDAHYNRYVGIKGLAL